MAEVGLVSMKSNVLSESRNLSISSASRAKRNLTLMIVLVSFLYSFGTLPWAVYHAVSSMHQTDYPTFEQIAKCCVYLLATLKIFIYYSFNKPFRLVTNSYLKKCCYCFIVLDRPVSNEPNKEEFSLK